LAFANLPLCLIACMSLSSHIGIADHYPSVAVDMLPGYSLMIPYWAPFLVFGFLFLRRFAKIRLTYYAITGLILLLTLSALAVICWEYYTVNYIYQHFQPLS